MRQIVQFPESEALSKEDVRMQLRAYPEEITAQSSFFDRVIRAVREAAEGELLRPLLPQRCRVRSDRLVGRIRLWQDVTEVHSVTYLDANGQRQLLDEGSWTLECQADLVISPLAPSGTDVEIEFTAGAFATAEDVPDSIKAWMLMQVGGLDANRAVAGSVQTYALPPSFSELYLRRWAMVGL